MDYLQNGIPVRYYVKGEEQNSIVSLIDYKNAVRKNRVLTIRDYYLGILETDTNKFHKIAKAKNPSLWDKLVKLFS